MIIDFTEIAQNNPSFRAYGGANGIKKGILLLCGDTKYISSLMRIFLTYLTLLSIYIVILYHYT